MTSTTDALSTWVPVPPDSPFPIQNLPYGLFVHPRNHTPHAGVAIGEQILDLSTLESRGFFTGEQLRDRRIFQRGSLNAFASLGKPAWAEARATIARLLRADEPTLRDDSVLRSAVLVPQAGTSMLLPVEIGDYTDFYSSREHATNVGAMLRGPDNALMPNWLHLPVAYHGRSSSIIVSGTDVRRPRGQYKADSAASPSFGPTRALDFELEVAAVVGPGNVLGEPIPIERAEDHLFGLVLLNDWSARDIQGWEYQPLGPFLSKNFATSISPWIVPLEALAPFRVAGPPQDPEPLPYLRQEGATTFDLRLEVHLRPAKAPEPVCITISNFRHLYWSLRQQVAHHTVNGCSLRPGDLLASGTVSGPTPDSLGCLLELTGRGTRPLALPGGETRRFLEDGDRVTMTGWGRGAGYRVGFGEVSGVVLPAG